MITERIRKIADWIESNQSVMDVGCDHGYLAKQLRINGHNAHIICSDNKKGPLANAKSNLIDKDNIDFVLCDGLSGLKEPVDIIVMAGMGNNTIEHILSQSEDLLPQGQQFILQCNTNIPELRKWLAEHNYSIADEEMVFDRKYYTLMRVVKKPGPLNELEMEYGPVLLKKRSELFLDYLKKEDNKFKQILKGIDPENEDAIQLNKKIQEIETILRGC